MPTRPTLGRPAAVAAVGAGTSYSRREILLTLTVILGLTFVMFRPVSHNLILYSVFSLIGLVAVLSLFRRRTLAPELIVIGFLVAAIATYGISLGPSNTGLTFTLLVWVIGPGLFLACAAAATPLALRTFFWGAALATLGVGGLVVLFVYGEAGRIPQLIPEWVVDQTGLGATFGGSASQARSFGLSSLNALGPLWAASLTLRRDHFLPPWPVRVVCLLVALAAAMVSSRSAIMVVIVAAPVIALVVRALIRQRPFAPVRFSSRILGTIALAGAFVAVVLAALNPRVQSLGPLTTAFQAVSSFFTGTSAGAGADESIRTDEATHLLDAWALNPILGSGFGAQVPSYARTSERPWVLELQYHLLLFNIGLVGMAVIIIIGVVAFVYIRRAVAFAPQYEATMVVSTTVGVAMLVANATNPYLQAPGHMWAIFLPLAAATVVLQASSRQAGDALPLRLGKVPRIIG